MDCGSGFSLHPDLAGPAAIRLHSINEGDLTMASSRQQKNAATDWINIMKQNNNNILFVLCIENKDCDDLEKRKVYQVLPDDKAADEGYLRIVDESGKDYLYPESYFIPVELPRKVQDALRMPK